MNDRTDSPYEQKPPSINRLLATALAAVIVALIALVTIVLPAEYGIDPTGLGKLTGLTELNQDQSMQSFEIVDVIGGNEIVREIEIPDAGEPVALPNPAVYQRQMEVAKSYSTVITLGPSDETEIKAVLQEAQVITYKWAVNQGDIYVDFHGHDPEMGNDFWVRYREGVEAAEGAGSLVAPFFGEHGWYFVNYNEFPVEITLNMEGYFDEAIDYGIWNRLE